MKPMGQTNIQLPNAKHKIKDNGKNLVGWWEDIGFENKKGARQEAKREISKELIAKTYS